MAGRYRGLCAVRSRALGLGLVSAAQLRVFPVRRGSGRADGGGVGAELEANPFYDRYRDKIQQLRRCGRRAGGKGREGAAASDACGASGTPCGPVPAPEGSCPRGGAAWPADVALRLGPRRPCGAQAPALPRALPRALPAPKFSRRRGGILRQPGWNRRFQDTCPACRMGA